MRSIYCVPGWKITLTFLNATVTGLISRTFHRRDVIGDSDFHGAAYVVQEIAKAYLVDDINFIKPGIGEATRVLLRRIPWKVLINPKYKDVDELKHIIQLAYEKGVSVEASSVDLGNYKACGIIKNLSDT